MELSGSFGYSSNVFSLTPTFVEIEAPDTRSLLDEAQAGDVEAFSEICRVYETRLLRQAIVLCGDSTLAEDPGRLLSLAAISAADGHVLWRSPVSRQAFGPPTYANGIVFVPSTVGFSLSAYAAVPGAQTALSLVSIASVQHRPANAARRGAFPSAASSSAASCSTTGSRSRTLRPRTPKPGVAMTRAVWRPTMSRAA